MTTMPSIPTVISISFAFWMLIYLGWLVFSPAYRRREGAAWRRLAEPHTQNLVLYAAAVILGAIWAVEWLRFGINGLQLLNIIAGIGGIVGLVIITRKRWRR